MSYKTNVYGPIRNLTFRGNLAYPGICVPDVTQSLSQNTLTCWEAYRLRRRRDACIGTMLLQFRREFFCLHFLTLNVAPEIKYSTLKIEAQGTSKTPAPKHVTFRQIPDYRSFRGRHCEKLKFYELF